MFSPCCVPLTSVSTRASGTSSPRRPLLAIIAAFVIHCPRAGAPPKEVAPHLSADETTSGDRWAPSAQRMRAMGADPNPRKNRRYVIFRRIHDLFLGAIFVDHLRPKVPAASFWPGRQVLDLSCESRRRSRRGSAERKVEFMTGTMTMAGQGEPSVRLPFSGLWISCQSRGLARGSMNISMLPPHFIPSSSASSGVSRKESSRHSPVSITSRLSA